MSRTVFACSWVIATAVVVIELTAPVSAAIRPIVEPTAPPKRSFGVHAHPADEPDVNATTTPHFIVAGRVTIPGDGFADMQYNEDDWDLLRQFVGADIATSLSLSANDVHVTNMRLGSLIVDFTATTSSVEQADATLERLKSLPHVEDALPTTTALYQMYRADTACLTISAAHVVDSNDADTGSYSSTALATEAAIALVAAGVSVALLW
jgi:hypothetical protein